MEETLKTTVVTGIPSTFQRPGFVADLPLSLLSAAGLMVFTFQYPAMVRASNFKQSTGDHQITIVSMKEKVRDRAETIIAESCLEDTPVLVESPPASGKTYNAVKLAAKGYKVLYLARRTDLYEQAQAEAEKFSEERGHELSATIIPSPHRNCDTISDENTKEENRYQWARREAKKLYQKGITAQTLHSNTYSEINMPCHSKGSPCEYISEIRELHANPMEPDLLIGNHKHAYNKRYVKDRIVIFDEFNLSAFLTRFPDPGSYVPDDPNAIIKAFLDEVEEIPCDDVTDLIEQRVLEGNGYESTLEWFRANEGANTKTVQELLTIDTDRHNTTHSLAGLLTCALLVMEKQGPGLELAHEPELWKDVGVNPAVRCVRDRNSGKMIMLRPPDLKLAQQVIGLDAVPIKRLWDVTLGCEFEKKTVLDRERIDDYLKDGLNLEIIQLTKNRHPYAAGKVSVGDPRRFKLARILAGQRLPLITTKSAFEKYQDSNQSESWLQDCVAPDPDEEGEYWVQTYGNVLSSNTFEKATVGFISGNGYPGDDVIKELCALCGEPTDIDRDSDSDRGFEISTQFGETIYRHKTHHQVFQAILRFGRNVDEPEIDSTVYVNTSTIPEWLSPRKLLILDGKQRIAAIRALIKAADCNGIYGWQRMTDVESKIDIDITKERIRQVLQSEVFAGCIERKQSAGKNGADIYRWVGDEYLHETGDIVSDKTHLFATDSDAIFLDLE